MYGDIKNANAANHEKEKKTEDLTLSAPIA